MDTAPAEGIKCAHAECTCQVAPDSGIEQDGRTYCSQDCASGRGCNHQNCHCGRD